MFVQYNTSSHLKMAYPFRSFGGSLDDTTKKICSIMPIDDRYGVIHSFGVPNAKYLAIFGTPNTKKF